MNDLKLTLLKLMAVHQIWSVLMYIDNVYICVMCLLKPHHTIVSLMLGAGDTMPCMGMDILYYR